MEMRVRKMKKIILTSIILMGAFLIIFKGDKVSANSTCNMEVTSSIKDPGTSRFYLCNGDNIYLMDDNRSQSSYFGTGYRDTFLYEVDVHNVENYYMRSLSVMARVYDDVHFKHIFTKGNGDNKWINITKDGISLYSGKFLDTLLNDSEDVYLPLFTEVGTYKIDQIVNDGIVDKSIYIHIVDPLAADFEITSATIDKVEITTKGFNNITNNSNNLNMEFQIAKSIHGINRTATLSVNGNELKVPVTVNEENYSINVRRALIFPHLMTNNTTSNPNIIILELSNNLNISVEFTYSLVIAEEKVVVILKTLEEEGILTSKKIDITAIPGVGNELISESNLYFLSRDPSLPSDKEDFMRRYKGSVEKGTYTNNSSVILRNHNGNFYLFVAAEDNKGFTVARSGLVKLQANNDQIGKITSDSVVFSIFVLILAVCPIAVYTFVKKHKQD